MNGILNRKSRSKLNAVTIKRQDTSGYNDLNYDIRMCYWGNGCCGKILSDSEHYAAEYKIIINDKEHYDDIYNFIISFDWRGYVNCISAKKIQIHHIITVLKNNLDFIQ